MLPKTATSLWEQELTAKTLVAFFSPTHSLKHLQGIRPTTIVSIPLLFGSIQADWHQKKINMNTKF